MNPEEYPARYIHIAGALAAGGTLTRIDPDTKINHQIPTIASVQLPDVGGLSETKTGPFFMKGKDTNLESIVSELRSLFMDRELISIGSAHALVQSDPEVEGGPAGSRTLSELNSFRMDGGVSLDHCRLSMRSVQGRTDPYPRFSLAGTELQGLKLGNYELKITLDLDTFNRYPTVNDLDTAFQRNADLRRELSARFATDPKTGGLFRGQSGFVVGSLFKSVEGLPPGATVKNGYTIDWPGFGQIIVGEVFMQAQIWKVSMVRIVHSAVLLNSGSSGGCWYP
jgi:hypothetical protein